MRGMVDRYWLPFFGEEFTVGELSEQYLEDFLQELANFRGLKGATINHARTCGATGLKWLKNKGVIRSNPMANVEAFSKSDATARGIPSEKEIKELYELDWDNEVMTWHLICLRSAACDLVRFRAYRSVILILIMT